MASPERTATGLVEVQALSQLVANHQAAMRDAAKRRRALMLELHGPGCGYEALAEACGTKNIGWIGRELSRARQEAADLRTGSHQ